MGSASKTSIPLYFAENARVDGVLRVLQTVPLVKLIPRFKDRCVNGILRATSHLYSSTQSVSSPPCSFASLALVGAVA